MRLRSVALLLLLSATPLPASASGFDFALERFVVSGGVSFVDEFDDGLRDSGPTARLRDRMGTRVSESGGVLRLSDGDGAGHWWVPFRDRSRDWLALNLPITVSSGATTIEGEFGWPASAGTGDSFGIGAAAYDGVAWQARGYVVSVEDVTAADYANFDDSLAACFVRDGLVAMLSAVVDDSIPFAFRGISACQPIDRTAITGSIVLRLRVQPTPPNVAMPVSAEISIDGGVTFTADSNWSGGGPGSAAIGWGASGRVFPMVMASGPIATSAIGVSVPGDESHGPGNALSALQGGLMGARSGIWPLVPSGIAQPGTFSLAASGSADLRAVPGAFELDVLDGHISATAERRNALRRIDLASGRPIAGDAPSGATCRTGVEPDCLSPGEPWTRNERVFEDLCRRSVGYLTLDRSVCALTVYNSQTLVVGDTLAHRLSILFGVALPVFANAIYAGLAGIAMNPVSLHAGVSDGAGDPYGHLSARLSDQQEALLGCGPHFGQAADGCDDYGVDLMNAEASALLQSIPGVEGTQSDTIVAGIPQPGTRSFAPFRGKVATRFVPGTGDIEIAGARGPWLSDGVSLNPDYDPRIDGCVSAGFDGLAPAGTCAGANLLHPMTGEPFASELAALSWNYLQFLIAFSSPDSDGMIEFDEFDSARPQRLDGCSQLRPQPCHFVAAMLALTRVALPDDPEAPRYRRWVWESGADYRIDSATGSLAPFAGGTVHALGPSGTTLSGVSSETPILLAFGAIDDPDGDGVASISDTCPTIADTEQFDADGDGSGDACDNCRFATNANQSDIGGVGAGSPPDGIGDACQCGDVTGDGRVTTADSVVLLRSRLMPPKAALARPGLCDVGGSIGCTNADAVILRRALLAPPTATIVPQCSLAAPTP